MTEITKMHMHKQTVWRVLYLLNSHVKTELAPLAFPFLFPFLPRSQVSYMQFFWETTVIAEHNFPGKIKNKNRSCPGISPSLMHHPIQSLKPSFVLSANNCHNRRTRLRNIWKCQRITTTKIAYCSLPGHI